MATKLEKIETREPGLSRFRLVLDGKTAGVIERFRPIPSTPSFMQYRFRFAGGGTLMDNSIYMAVANTRAECVEEAVSVTKAIWQDDHRRFAVTGVSAEKLIEDLKRIRRKLDKSFEERGGSHGSFTNVEADLSGQRRYILDKLHDLGFDNRVISVLGFGPIESWQREEVAV